MEQILLLLAIAITAINQQKMAANAEHELKTHVRQTAMRTKLAAGCLLNALFAASSLHAQSQPTATEIFYIRHKCKSLADNIAAKESELFNNKEGTFLSYSLSYYGINKHHYYALITDSNLTSDTKIVYFELLKLYDADTGEVLAEIQKDYRNPAGTEPKDVIRDKHYSGLKDSYVETQRYISEKSGGGTLIQSVSPKGDDQAALRLISRMNM